MVAYHFPPLAGSSGIQRTLRFMQHLPALGWTPLVLTTQTRAYERTSDDLMHDVPEGTVVRRAFALDTARQLAVGGRYVAAMARPDRWISWRYDGIRQGLAMIREFKPDLIWSTYPIATAHVIGAELQRRSGLPWVADFRDPMAQEGYPTDRRTWQSFDAIERATLHRAAASVFTTPSAAAEYRRRYPALAARVHLIENGYDEESFAAAPAGDGTPLTPGALTLLHSGVVYESERDPTQLLLALKRLHDAGVIAPGTLKLRFRAAVSEELIRTLAARHEVQAYVELAPPIPYKEALAEMQRADALVVMQASNCNAQIPAKIYEYLRAGRPVLCFADPVGDTALAIGAAGIGAIAPLDDAAAIAGLLQRFISRDPACPPTLPRADAVRDASRRGRTESLVRILETAVAGATVRLPDPAS